MITDIEMFSKSVQALERVAGPRLGQMEIPDEWGESWVNFNNIHITPIYLVSKPLKLTIDQYEALLAHPSLGQILAALENFSGAKWMPGKPSPDKWFKKTHGHSLFELVTARFLPTLGEKKWAAIFSNLERLFSTKPHKGVCPKPKKVEKQSVGIDQKIAGTILLILKTNTSNFDEGLYTKDILNVFKKVNPKVSERVLNTHLTHMEKIGIIYRPESSSVAPNPWLPVKEGAAQPLRNVSAER